MFRVLKILKPLLFIAGIVGVIRLMLSVLHAPRPVVYIASLTVVELAGTLYLSIRMAREPALGYLHLWAGNLILFGFCQLLYLVGLVYTYVSGTPTLYHESERLRAFLGYEPTLLEHMWMHVQNWMVIAPTIATWVVGAPIVWLMRRRSSRRASMERSGVL
jgi:hypothetical protein